MSTTELVIGIAGTGDLKAMGRIGLKALIYFEAATTIALFLGLGIGNNLTCICLFFRRRPLTFGLNNHLFCSQRRCLFFRLGLFHFLY